MEIGEFLTRWTVRIAVVLYVLSLASRRFAPAWSRWAWTGGCLAYLLHVAAAFHYYHDWSHDEAYESTARQTAEVVGVNWGEGLYVNYLFTLAWSIDVLWWWIAARSYVARSRVIEWVVHGFLGFVVFNATVVFASGFSRWLGIGACILVAAVWLWPRKEKCDASERNH